MKSKAGLVIRIVILGVAVLNSISFGLAPEVEQMKNGLPNGFLLLASAVAFLYMGGFSYFALNWNWKLDKNKNWSEPTWLTHPFSGPLQFFHLMAFFFIGFGLPAFLIRMAAGKGIFFETFVLCGGIGVLLGVKQFVRRNQNQLTAG